MWVGLDKALRPPPWENSGDGEGGPWILPISGRLIISLGSAWVGFTVAPLSFLGILAFGGPDVRCSFVSLRALAVLPPGG